MGKRLFDILFSSCGLLFLSPLFLIIALAIKLDSTGPVFFKQERVGRNFVPFYIYKFRTMIENAEHIGPQITFHGDSRVTRIGNFLRKYKLDELPQLFNVLKGEMSFVGPRPEIRKYVEIFQSDYEKLLTVRPGITDYASIDYSDEENVFKEAHNFERYYIEGVLPAKIKLSMKYINKQNTLFNDLSLILKTLISVISLKSIRSKLNEKQF